MNADFIYDLHHLQYVTMLIQSCFIVERCIINKFAKMFFFIEDDYGLDAGNYERNVRFVDCF